jgi:hypothetical protein
MTHADDDHRDLSFQLCVPCNHRCARRRCTTLRTAAPTATTRTAWPTVATSCPWRSSLRPGPLAGSTRRRPESPERPGSRLTGFPTSEEAAHMATCPVRGCTLSVNGY